MLRYSNVDKLTVGGIFATVDEFDFAVRRLNQNEKRVGLTRILRFVFLIFIMSRIHSCTIYSCEISIPQQAVTEIFLWAKLILL